MPGTATPPTTAADDAVDLIAEATSDEWATATPVAIRPASATSLAAGSRLGQYRLIRELGAGGMGIVFEAEDEWLHRRVALKVLRADLPAEQIARERFLREARAMAAVESDHVVTVYSVGEVNDRPYMAMQLLAGETLETRLRRETRLSTLEAARIGREVALGLVAAHARGLVHRDVKPSNVWLEAGTGRVKLLDFGLTLARDNSHLTHSGLVIGTPAFMSPEQARADALDGRSDLFSLGVTLYLALTGERPFDGADVLAVMRNLELHYPTRVNVKRADVPAPFSNLVMELLAKDRKDRPESAAVVAERLARGETTRTTHLPVAPPAVPTPPAPVAPGDEAWPGSPLPRPSSFNRALCLIGVMVIGLVAFLYLHATNYGHLAIETDIAEAEVQIRQNGQLKQTSASNRRIDLRPGTYELVLVRPKDGYRLSRSVVEVRRNGQESVRVVRNLSSR